MTALETLEIPSEENEDFSGPEPEDIKIMLEDALTLLGNAVFRLNSWRQRRFSEYFTDLGSKPSNQTFQLTSICSLIVFIKLFKANTTTHRPIISWWLPPLLVNSNSRSRSHVSSHFIDNPFRDPSAPMNERERGEVDGLVNNIPQNKEPPLPPATEATTKVTKTDYTLSFTQHIERTTLTAERLTHFQQNWKQLTNNTWILQTISGYHIPFIRCPVQVHPLITRTIAREQWSNTYCYRMPSAILLRKGPYKK